MISVILAAPDLSDEPGLVAAATLHGIVISRRSLDAADLLAAAAADTTMAVAVSAGVPRLSGDLIGRIMADERIVVGIAVSDDDERRLRAWNVPNVIRHHGDPVATIATIATLVSGGSHRSTPDSAARIGREAGGSDAGGRDAGGRDQAAPAAAPEAGARPCLLVAVWGPTGAPGRTTTALSVAESLADNGYSVCLVDADTYAPSLIAQVGVNAEASGLVVACRQADNGTLNARTLVAATRLLSDRLSILGGLVRAERWPDLREAALRTLWRVAREAFDVVVVDIGSCIEEEGAIAHLAGSPLLASRRNAAAVTALEAADHVLVTARSSTLGLTRLLNELPAVTSVNDAACLTLVLTGASGLMAPTSISDRMLRQLGLRAEVVRLPRDAARLERAIRDGITPYEAASRRERRMLSALARGIAPIPAGSRT
jgi:cellulose biosynthesis protein BcsQ